MKELLGQHDVTSYGDVNLRNFSLISDLPTEAMLFIILYSYLTRMVDSVFPLMARSGGVYDIDDVKYRRITPSPMVWRHLRKSNVTIPPIPKLEDLLAAAVRDRDNKTQIHASFLQADPMMIRNGLQLGRPLRRPAQAYINTAVSENVPGIKGEKYANLERAEMKRLQGEFSKGLRELMILGQQQ